MDPVRSTVPVTRSHRDLETFVLLCDLEPIKTLLGAIASWLARVVTLATVKTLIRRFLAVLFIIVKVGDRVTWGERFQLKPTLFPCVQGDSKLNNRVASVYSIDKGQKEILHESRSQNF